MLKEGTCLRLCPMPTTGVLGIMCPSCWGGDTAQAMLPFNKKRLFHPSHLPQLQLTWMKEKSSSLSAGQASDGGGPSGPSVDSSSELERSTLELRRSLELSC